MTGLTSEITDKVSFSRQHHHLLGQQDHDFIPVHGLSEDITDITFSMSLWKLITMTCLFLSLIYKENSGCLSLSKEDPLPGPSREYDKKMYDILRRCAATAYMQA